MIVISYYISVELPNSDAQSRVAASSLGAPKLLPDQY